MWRVAGTGGVGGKGEIERAKKRQGSVIRKPGFWWYLLRVIVLAASVGPYRAGMIRPLIPKTD